MNLKEQIAQDLVANNTKCWKMRYYKQSPYQKNRYKPEYVEQEVWLYPKSGWLAHCITESDWANKDFKEMVIAELKTVWG